MLGEAVVGPKVVADGSLNALRASRDGSLVTVDGHSPLQEAVVRGNVFLLDSGSVTLETLNQTTEVAGKILLFNGFFNPVTSGKNAVILYAVVHTVSGTPTGGYVWNAQQATSGLSNAAKGTIRNALLGGGVGSAMTPEANIKITRTDAGTAAFLQIAVLGGPTAIAVAGGNYTAIEKTDGRLVVPPGWVVGLAEIGAGTQVVQSTICWEEIPV